MAGRVTIQNIADALGVSRNTVSKALNNTGVLAESTRERILKKAVEMGYKQLSYFCILTMNTYPFPPYPLRIIAHHRVVVAVCISVVAVCNLKVQVLGIVYAYETSCCGVVVIFCHKFMTLSRLYKNYAKSYIRTLIFVTK